MIQIWKDTYYTEQLTDGGSIEYSIGTTLNGIVQTIFNGKAWANPNTNAINIKINDLVKDYLQFELPDLNNIGDTTISHPNAIKTFFLYTNDNDDTEVASYKFIKDWSYKDYANDTRSNPINGRGIEGQLYFNTYVDDDLLKTHISHTPNNLYTENICDARYVLYYLNRWCGMDSFVIEGKVIKTDNYTPYFITSSYNNTTTEFGKKIYHNDITTSYELHTGWLKDTESENLAFNLLSSNLVYLHDIKENKIMPVVITNTSTDYKTFKNQNNKLYNYTISVECSQKEYRL